MQPYQKPRPFRGLIFDLDGVIIATEPLHEEAKRIAYSDFGLLVPGNLFGEFRGRSDEDMAEFVTRTKPHPEPYLTAAARLGLSPDACLVIEDSKNGILSAKAAGCAVAAITTSSTRTELADADADFTVDTFAELAGIMSF